MPYGLVGFFYGIDALKVCEQSQEEWWAECWFGDLQMRCPGTLPMFLHNF